MNASISMSRSQACSVQTTFTSRRAQSARRGAACEAQRYR
jgi:hypothetical protein